jgi:membrane protein YqaA with SNARE-associated domain
MFGGSRSYFLGCKIQMVDPVSTKQLTSILKIKHFKNKLMIFYIATSVLLIWERKYLPWMKTR